MPALRRIAGRGMGVAADGWLSGDKVPNACILALGRIGSDGAINALRWLAGSTQHNGFRKRIVAALDVAATAAGLTPGQLVERTVTTAGLDDQHTVVLTSGAAVGRATLDAELKTQLEWMVDGRWARKPAAGVPAEDVNRVKRQVKEIRDAVASERRRVESLFADDRCWELADWQRYYLEHPITGRVTQRLIWRCETAARSPASRLRTGYRPSPGPPTSPRRALCGSGTRPHVVNR